LQKGIASTDLYQMADAPFAGLSVPMKNNPG